MYLEIISHFFYGQRFLIVHVLPVHSTAEPWRYSLKDVWPWLRRIHGEDLFTGPRAYAVCVTKTGAPSLRAQRDQRARTLIRWTTEENLDHQRYEQSEELRVGC